MLQIVISLLFLKLTFRDICRGALAAYPHLGCTGGPYEVWKIWGVSDQVLCAGNDSVLTFIDDVLTEVMDIFPF